MGGEESLNGVLGWRSISRRMRHDEKRGVWVGGEEWFLSDSGGRSGIQYAC